MKEGVDQEREGQSEHTASKHLVPPYVNETDMLKFSSTVGPRLGS